MAPYRPRDRPIPAAIPRTPRPAAREVAGLGSLDGGTGSGDGSGAGIWSGSGSGITMRSVSGVSSPMSGPPGGESRLQPRGVDLGQPELDERPQPQGVPQAQQRHTVPAGALAQNVAPVHLGLSRPHARRQHEAPEPRPPPGGALQQAVQVLLPRRVREQRDDAATLRPESFRSVERDHARAGHQAEDVAHGDAADEDVELALPGHQVLQVPQRPETAGAATSRRLRAPDAARRAADPGGRPRSQADRFVDAGSPAVVGGEGPQVAPRPVHPPHAPADGSLSPLQRTSRLATVGQGERHPRAWRYWNATPPPCSAPGPNGPARGTLGPPRAQIAAMASVTSSARLRCTWLTRATSR